jgi:hypothetical protein
MKLPWTPFDEHDILRLAVVGIALGLFILVAVGYPPSLPSGTHTAFGPEWDCMSIGDSGPICLKKVSNAK